MIMKKTIYLVRHAESEGNAGKVNNTHETPLTEKGRAQAALIARKNHPISMFFFKRYLDVKPASPWQVFHILLK